MIVHFSRCYQGIAEVYCPIRKERKLLAPSEMSTELIKDEKMEDAMSRASYTDVWKAIKEML